MNYLQSKYVYPTIKKYARFIAALFVVISTWFRGQVASAQTKHVILISIDGFHPDMYLNKDWPTPNLKYLMQQGTYSDKLISVFPSYTYPSHTAMLTGAMPARSGIFYNQPMNNKGDWNWYAKYTKVPTIWKVLHDNQMTTAAVYWPGTVDNPDITYNLSEIWDNAHPDDRATVVKEHATPKGIYEEIEQNATGKLDSTNMNDNYFSLDENAGRIAAYIIQKYKPAFLALHFATVDGTEHEYGRDADSVRLAVECNDRAIGDVLEAIDKANIQDSTAVIIVGDHGFSTIHEILRPNLLIKTLPVRFIAAGGSAFLYLKAGAKATDVPDIIKAVTDSLNDLPKDKRKLFRIINRKELNRMGVDSSAILALSGLQGSGLVFSGSIAPSQIKNHGPGTLIQNNELAGVFIPTAGGHHGYDPNNPDMWTGFISAGAGIIKGGHIESLNEVDIAPLVARLLGVEFETPDGILPLGVIASKR